MHLQLLRKGLFNVTPRHVAMWSVQILRSRVTCLESCWHRYEGFNNRSWCFRLKDLWRILWERKFIIYISKHDKQTTVSGVSFSKEKTQDASSSRWNMSLVQFLSEIKIMFFVLVFQIVFFFLRSWSWGSWRSRTRCYTVTFV